MLLNAQSSEDEANQLSGGLENQNDGKKDA